MKKPFEERLWEKVDKRGEDECWLWTGAVAGSYGRIQRDGKCENAHRVTYELTKGIIPEGYQVDHLCKNRLCVNPKHLEAVTQRENLLRGDTIVAKHAAKTHCPQGHEYTEENTYVSKKGSRYCRACRRKYLSNYYYNVVKKRKEEGA